MSTGAASLVAGRLPLISISLSVCLGLVQAAVVDQLPSMVSFVWALKGRNISTWLYTVLHCSGYTVLFYCHGCYVKLEGGFLASIGYFPLCLTLMYNCKTWR